MSPKGAARAAVVTGAASGIGAAIAEQLSADGWPIALLDIDLDAVRRVASRLERTGAVAVPVEADVADERSVLRAVEHVGRQFESVGVLVNNAGVQHVAPLADLTSEAWRRVIDVDLTSVFVVTKAFLGSLAAGGSVINIGSLGGQLGIPDRLAYSAAKGGVAAMTRSLAVELARYDVRANCVAPGAVPTALNDGGRTSRPDDVLNAGGLRSRLGAAGDIAAVVSFLASPASRHVNGVTLPVDGGASAAFAG